ncbi:MAG: hypothetical protein WA323_14500, partial [Candidatus Nitrosopolaris sp.]
IIPCISKVGPESYQKQILKMTDENRLYEKVKNYLKKSNWTILGGQPARGTNHLPVIEIKSYAHTAKGSKGSKKIDLVAFKDPFFLICEAKGSYSQSDISKINELTGSHDQRLAFINALLEKRVLKSNNIVIEDAKYTMSDTFLIKGVGYNILTSSAPEDFVTFVLQEDVAKPFFGRKISDEVKYLFTHS